MQTGIFTISLDFELFWGVRDKKTQQDYKENILGARAVIPKLLEIFLQHNIHATWATVGFLFAKNKEELRTYIPEKLPGYRSSRLSPYKHIDSIGENEEVDPFHYANSLICQISNYPGQEIGSHTMSHFYCLEEGQNISDFETDIKNSILLAQKNNIQLKSFIFPRNQLNPEYISICKKYNIESYRGNEKSFIYKENNEANTSLLIKILRFTDTYFNLTGYNTFTINANRIPINIKSSKFFRPYNKKLKILEPLKIRRIKKAMTYAAKNKRIFHLWWHPHNFGISIENNIDNLLAILRQYQILNKQYGMISQNMSEISSHINNPHIFQ